MSNGSRSPAGPADPAGGQYGVRLARVMDCVRLRQPDRMPVGFFATFWLAKYGGFSCRDMMFDYERVLQVSEQACQELQPDLYSPFVLSVSFGRPIEAMGYRQLDWPGHGVGPEQPFQYRDREYMSADEYDDFLFDPTGFFLQKYLPRVCEAYEGIEGLASLAGSMYVGSCFAAAAFADPKLTTALERLRQAGGVALEYFGQVDRFDRRMRALGFPASFGTVTVAPYDAVADFCRGATGMMKDMFRHGDKLPAVLDKMATLLIRQTLAQAQNTDNPLVFIPLHWAPDGFMSQRQFEQFWWPPFHRLLLALIDADLVPMPFWESDCTRRLPFLREHTPPGKCIYWFERTDMVRACEALGDRVALRGGVPASLLVSGTPEDVDLQVRRLVETVVNKGGRLILDASIGLPDEASVDNVRAMFAAARRYG